MPVTPDQDLRFLGPRSRWMFQGLLWIIAVGGLTTHLYNLSTAPENMSMLQYLLGFCFPGIGVVSLILWHRGHEVAALNLFLWGITSATFATALIISGVRTPVLAGLPLIVMTGAWLLGTRQGYLIGFTSAVFVLALGYLQETGVLTFTHLRPPLPTGVVIALYLALSTLFGITVAREIREENDLARGLTESLRDELDQRQKSSQRFKNLFRSNPLPAQINDAQGNIVDVNQVWVDTFGIAREQAIGKRPSQLAVWNDVEQIRQVNDKVARLGELHDEQINLRVASGETRHFLLTLASFESDEGLLYVCNMIDLTDRLAAEAAQRDLNVQLEARVAERTADLNQTVARLSQAQEELVSAEKLASLGAMVAGISHELNTPIGNAVTVASALRERIAIFQNSLADGSLKRSQLDRFVADLSDMSTLVERSSIRASELITSFKQVAVDQTSEQRRRFDLRTLTEDVVTTLRPAFKRHAWTVSIDMPEGLVCDSYPGPLGQILTNLIQNASLHAFEGRDHGTITVRARTMGETRLSLDVLDDGIGMDRNTLAHVFDPFFTTKLGRGGSGLGLSVCHRIATTVLGGTLTVESHPGQGSTFTLVFPAIAHGRV